MTNNHAASRLGYDTRSLRSALVMRAIDMVNPLKRAEPLQWRGPVVVSSIAGLGDLFVHLPLISGIVDTCRERGLSIKVALRPAHVEIGRRCGWHILPFDSGLEDFFKNPRAFRFLQFATTIRDARKIAPRFGLISPAAPSVRWQSKCLARKNWRHESHVAEKVWSIIRCRMWSRRMSMQIGNESRTTWAAMSILHWPNE
jgi:hypothetical protein